MDGIKKLIKLFFITILLSSISFGADQKDRSVSLGLVLVDIPKYRSECNLDSIYCDIMSHSKEKPFGNAHGRSTNAHETVHGINSYLRNKYHKNNIHVNGFYAGSGKGIVLENPKLKLRDVSKYIPEILRGYRYKLYFIEQLQYWDDTPTYPIDEWSAYIAGAECAVDDVKQGLAKENSDIVFGSLEFSIYCTALALAVKNKDNNYWNNNLQFKETIKYYLIKAEKVFFEGKDHFPFKAQDDLLLKLKKHENAKEIRDFLTTEFEGIFID